MAYRFNFCIANNLDVGVEFLNEESGIPFYFPPEERKNFCQFELESEAVNIHINPEGGTGESGYIPLLQTTGGISSVKGGNGHPWIVRIRNSFPESTTSITVGSKYPMHHKKTHA
jgi:hypothetical protein